MKEPVEVHSQPELENASLVVGWQEDAGKLGPKVIDYLNKHIRSKSFCEIEPVKFFPHGFHRLENLLIQEFEDLRGIEGIGIIEIIEFSCP